MANILVIDDQDGIRSILREILTEEGHSIDEAKDGAEGFDKVRSGKYDLALCDLKMPRLDGMSLLKKVSGLSIETQFIMISAHGNIEAAVEATKMGAYDFIEKPPELNRLLVTVRNALDKSDLVAEAKNLRKQVSGMHDIVGESEAIMEVKETIERVAPTEARVLITGPNGSGKELVAKWLHAKSPRADKPLVAVNCAAIPSELIESELFGHEKGAFTGAKEQRRGKFEQANGGTLFLDEIGDMSLSAQAKVLRALQERKVQRVGGDKEIRVDVRVFAATNKDLEAEIKEGAFREDLYYRLNVIVIRVPPLNERKDDVPLLVERFLDDICAEYGQPKREIEEAALQKLQETDWSGNVRQLRNVTERLIIMTGQTITAEDVERYV